MTQEQYEAILDRMQTDWTPSTLIKAFVDLYESTRWKPVLADTRTDLEEMIVLDDEFCTHLLEPSIHGFVDYDGNTIQACYWMAVPTRKHLPGYET